MTSNAPVAFFSYAGGDDANEGGAILELAEHLQNECQLLLGRDDFEIFVDRTSIRWGEEWKERIDTALSKSTFLVPIVTPRYFCRHECIRELNDFKSAADRPGQLDVGKTTLPILYVPVDGLGMSSTNPAKAFIARVQYEDWRKNRLTRPSSQPYRAGIHRLATRLVDTLEQCPPLDAPQVDR